VNAEDLAERAAERVREIIAEAEQWAGEIVRKAEDEAGQIRSRAESEAHGRVDEARQALDELEERLGAPLRQGSEADQTRGHEARPRRPKTSRRAKPEPKAKAPVQEPEQPASAAAEAEPGPPGVEAGDAQAARLVAMKLALDGTPSDAAKQELASQYDLPDLGSLVDEVYGKAGR